MLGLITKKKHLFAFIIHIEQNTITNLYFNYFTVNFKEFLKILFSQVYSFLDTKSKHQGKERF